jgi:hypothetical protein
MCIYLQIEHPRKFPFCSTLESLETKINPACGVEELLDHLVLP